MSASLLNADELAERWQVPKPWIWAKSRENVIPNVKLGRGYRYRLDQIEAFELAGGMDANP